MEAMEDEEARDSVDQLGLGELVLVPEFPVEEAGHME